MSKDVKNANITVYTVLAPSPKTYLHVAALCLPTVYEGISLYVKTFKNTEEIAVCCSEVHTYMLYMYPK